MVDYWLGALGKGTWGSESLKGLSFSFISTFASPLLAEVPVL